MVSPIAPWGKFPTGTMDSSWGEDRAAIINDPGLKPEIAASRPWVRGPNRSPP